MDDDLRTRLHAALADTLSEVEGDMLVKWVLTAEVIDADGKRAVWTCSPQGQLVYESVGLLEFAKAVEAAGLVDGG